MAKHSASARRGKTGTRPGQSSPCYDEAAVALGATIGGEPARGARLAPPAAGHDFPLYGIAAALVAKGDLDDAVRLTTKMIASIENSGSQDPHSWNDSRSPVQGRRTFFECEHPRPDQGRTRRSDPHGPRRSCFPGIPSFRDLRGYCPGQSLYRCPARRAKPRKRFFGAGQSAG